MVAELQTTTAGFAENWRMMLEELPILLSIAQA
jgi:hypothetical protein